MFLLIDFINQKGNRAFTSRLDKIQKNVDLFDPLKAGINQRKQTKKEPFSVMTVCGRWLLVYQANGLNDKDTVMHFVDFRVDLTSTQEIFSNNTLKNLLSLQKRYTVVFTEKMDTVELTRAEPFETVLKENFFTCYDESIVIAKAKQLGLFLAIENLAGKDTVKVAITDEKQTVDTKIITNLYAVLHFGGHERKQDHGFAYLKIYDLENNLDKIGDFQKGVEAAGVKFDTAFWMERFHEYNLN